MADAHEQTELAEQVGHLGSTNKRIALLIAIFALFLAFAETLGKSAQTHGVNENVEASNLWAFFQAKTIRITTLRTAADAGRLNIDAAQDAGLKAAWTSRIDAWNKTAARYEDEAEPPEGRKQLMARANLAEQRRDKALAEYHLFEFAAAAFQIGIVLLSATVITGMLVLAYVAVMLALAGAGLMGVAVVAPLALHLF